MFTIWLVSHNRDLKITQKNAACTAPTNTEEIILKCDSVQYKDINNTGIDQIFKSQTQPQGVVPIKEEKTLGVQNRKLILQLFL